MTRPLPLSPPLALAIPLACSLLLLFCLLAGPARAAEPAANPAGNPAGSVKNAAAASVIRAGAAPLALNSGDRVFEKDVLVTAGQGSLGLILRDNTTLALGPGARLVLERFHFEPASGGLAQTLRLTRGSLAAVSGEIAKLNPAAAKVDTPLYTIGIRGTHFLLSVEPGAETPVERAQ